MNPEILRNTERNDAMNLRGNVKNIVENIGNAVMKLRIDERMTGDIKGLEEETAVRGKVIKIEEDMEEADDRSTSRIYFYQ
jgi:hypothetical protein